MQTEHLQAPVSDSLAHELTASWQDAFEIPPAESLPILRGDENAHNDFHVYLIRDGGRLAGTCTVTHSRSMPTLAGLGAVTTHPDFRRRGIARALCERARDDFAAAGGVAIYLGTSNPDAARGYRRLAWRRLAGSNVMLCVSDGRSPEQFLVDEFRRDTGSVHIERGTASHRITMISLLLTALDPFVLDANANLHSIRHATQGSCMGLYPRYEAIDQAEGGAWFAAVADDGRTLGLASAAPVNDTIRVDAFTHPCADSHCDELLIAAIAHAADRGRQVEALLCAEDRDKRARFASHGFADRGSVEQKQVGDQPVDMHRYTLA